ncbi:MAG: aldehyde dehydrogenase family protein [Candidatus Xenobia bacterium]
MATHVAPRVITVRSPRDGAVLCELPAAGPEDVDAMVERAVAAQKSWGALKPAQRVERLLAVQEVLLRRRREVARQLALEQGKPQLEAVAVEIIPCLEAVTWLASHAPRLLADRAASHRIPFWATKRASYIFEPLGTVACIAPWNYPLSIPFIQAAYALAAGNAVIVKPASLTAGIGMTIGELFWEAGFPRDLVQVLIAPGTVAERLVAHPDVPAVVFTGSVEGGRKVQAAAGLKKVILELGGKDPMLVLEDADFDRAVHGALWGSFVNCGQTCASIERIYVPRQMYEPFLERLGAAARELKVGDPLERTTDIGPMTSEEQLQLVESHVAEALAQGARLVAGGHRLHGQYHEPTVLADVRHGMRVVDEETFGPVAPVLPYDTIEEAVAMANRSPYGLTASVWGRDLKQCNAVARRVQAGVVTINDHLFSFGEGESMWGGMKESGVGHTHGRFGLEAMAEVRYLDVDPGGYPSQMWWFPYRGPLGDLLDATCDMLYHPRTSRRLLAVAALVPALGWMWKRLDVPRTMLKLLPELLPRD